MAMEAGGDQVIDWYLDRPLLDGHFFHTVMNATLIDVVNPGDAIKNVITVNYTSTPYAGACCDPAFKPQTFDARPISCCADGSWAADVKACLSNHPGATGYVCGATPTVDSGPAPPQPGLVLTDEGGSTFNYLHGSSRRYPTAQVPSIFKDEYVINVKPPTVAVNFKEDSTDPNTPTPMLAIGEVVTLQVEAYVPEGRTSVSIDLKVPSNFAVLSAAVTHVGAAFASAPLNTSSNITDTASDEVTKCGIFLPVNGKPVPTFDADRCLNDLIGFWRYHDSTGDTIVLNQGLVQNTPDNQINDADRMRFEVKVRMLNILVNDGVYPGVTQPVLKANVRYSDFERVQGMKLITTVVEPKLITTVDRLAPSQQNALIDGRDRLKLRVTVSHSSTASKGPAYDGTLLVPVEPEMILHFDTVAVTASCLYSVTLVNPLLFQVWWADLNTTADKVVVTFEATAIDKVHPNEFFYQWGKTSYASMPAWDPRQDVDARFHLDGDLSYPWSTGRHLISVAPVTIASNLVATSLADTPTYYLAIGETATYDVTLTLPESSTNLKTRFQLPKGFGCRNAYVKFIGSSVNDSALAVGQRLVCPPPDSQGRRLIEFAFGQLRVVPDNVRNLNDTIVISVEGQVLDDSTLANNNRLATTALFYTYNARANHQGSVAKSVRVALPLVQTTSTIPVHLPAYDAGDVLECTVTVYNRDARKVCLRI